MGTVNAVWGRLGDADRGRTNAEAELDPHPEPVHVTMTWDVADLYRGNGRKGVRRVWLAPQALHGVLAGLAMPG